MADDKNRVNMHLTDRTSERTEALKEIGEFASITELFRKTVHLMEVVFAAAIAARKDGDDIEVIVRRKKTGHETKVKVPGL